MDYRIRRRHSERTKIGLDRPWDFLSSIPGAEGNTVSLHEVAAARAASGVLPRFHEMPGIDWTGRFGLAPDQRRRLLGGGIYRAVDQNGGRNFRPVKSGEADDVLGVGPPALPFEDVVQLAAIAADHRLDFTMQTAIGAAGDVCAVLALRTFKEVRIAHLLEIQPRAG